MYIEPRFLEIKIEIVVAFILLSVVWKGRELICLAHLPSQLFPSPVCYQLSITRWLETRRFVLEQ